MKEEAVAALNAADEKVMEAFKKENGDILFREVKEKTAASPWWAFIISVRRSCLKP